MVFLIFFLFLEHIVAFKGGILFDCQYGDCDFSTVASPQACDWSQRLVFAPQGHHLSFSTATAANLPGPTGSSLTRPWTSSPSCSSNGYRNQSPLALRAVQAAEKTFSAVLHHLPATVAECHRHFVCPWQQESATDQWRRTISTSTTADMAQCTRMATAVAAFPRKNTIAEATCTSQECQRSEVSEVSSSSDHASSSAASNG